MNEQRFYDTAVSYAQSDRSEESMKATIVRVLVILSEITKPEDKPKIAEVLKLVI